MGPEEIGGTEAGCEEGREEGGEEARWVERWERSGGVEESRKGGGVGGCDPQPVRSTREGVIVSSSSAARCTRGRVKLTRRHCPSSHMWEAAIKVAR